MASALLPATKFTFDPESTKWLRTRVRLQLAKRPFAEGGMRVVYRMREFDARENNGEYVEGVAKKFKPDCEDKRYYYDEAMTQMVSESYAQEFNKRGTGIYLGFLPVSVLKLDLNGTLYNTEPYLRGDYVKHNDNSGHVDTKELLPQAFSHFTYECSNQTLLVVDIQGVGDYYTDPQIHSFDGQGFGLGNLGRIGIEKFLRSHQCNKYCKMLGLKDPRDRPSGAQNNEPENDFQMARRLQQEEVAKTKKQWTSKRWSQEIRTLRKMVNNDHQPKKQDYHQPKKQDYHQPKQQGYHQPEQNYHQPNQNYHELNEQQQYYLNHQQQQDYQSPELISDRGFNNNQMNQKPNQRVELKDQYNENSKPKQEFLDNFTREDLEHQKTIMKQIELANSMKKINLENNHNKKKNNHLEPAENIDINRLEYKHNNQEYYYPNYEQMSAELQRPANQHPHYNNHPGPSYSQQPVRSSAIRPEHQRLTRSLVKRPIGEKLRGSYKV